MAHGGQGKTATKRRLSSLTPRLAWRRTHVSCLLSSIILGYTGRSPELGKHRRRRYVSGLSGEVEFVDFLGARDGLSVSQSTTRSGDFSAGVGNIRRSPEECTDPCIAKAWATVPSAGEVVEFTIIRNQRIPMDHRTHSIGRGTSWDLEVASDNSRLVGTDLEGQRIFSIDLSNEDVQSLSIGTIAGPIRFRLTIRFF